MDKKKIEIEIPEGWEVDEPDKVRRVTVENGIMQAIVGVHKIDTREGWQKDIDDFIANGIDHHMLIMKNGGGSAIPPEWTAKEYRGWKFYQPPQAVAVSAPVPAWVTAAPHNKGYDWRVHDSTGTFETKDVPGDKYSDGSYSNHWILDTSIWNWLIKGCPPPSNWRNERYHYENGRWVHKPYGTMPGEKP